ncbi:MAG: hypothetical protein C6W55_17440 [Thermobacillus sp.]|nr:MAG: hypothetical protein C6W55_17440 [Thermobacillus sp.]
MRMRKWLALAFAALLLFAAGCQAVQGVDLNGVLKQSFKTTAAEGSLTYEFELDLSKELLNELAGEEEAAAILPLLTHVKLQIDEYKVKDPWNISMRGTLWLGDIGIGFSAQMADTLMVVELDGASAPIVIDLSAADEELSDVALSDEQLRQTQEMMLKFLESSGDYLVDNMPNVSDLSVALSTPVTVGGEELSLTRVSVRFDGAELFEWLKKYLEALIADEEGARTLVQSLATMLSEQSALFADSELPVDELAIVEEEEDIAAAAEELIGALKEAAAGLAYLEAAEPEMIQAIFNDSLQVRADLYVDGKLHIRKQDVEVEFRPDAEELKSAFGENPIEGLNGIRLAYSAELWNINGDVELAKPQVPEDGGITPENMAEWSTADALRFFDTESGLYELLANRFKIGEQELRLYPEFDDPAPIKAPNGWTLVPLRDTAEYFEAEVKFDPKTKNLILRDDATGNEVVLTVGSNKVAVNGKTVEWGYPVTVMADGVTYVPARNLMEMLGGSVAWINEDGSQVLVMKRDVAELIVP